MNIVLVTANDGSDMQDMFGRLELGGAEAQEALRMIYEKAMKGMIEADSLVFVADWLIEHFNDVASWLESDGMIISDTEIAIEIIIKAGKVSQIQGELEKISASAELHGDRAISIEALQHVYDDHELVVLFSDLLESERSNLVKAVMIDIAENRNLKELVFLIKEVRGQCGDDLFLKSVCDDALNRFG